MIKGYGEFIKRNRLASGYKRQSMLADVSGISAPTISRIEKEIHLPDVKTLRTFSSFFKTTTFIELLVACGYLTENDIKENAAPTIDLSDENRLDTYRLTLGDQVLITNYEELKSLFDDKPIVDLSNEYTLTNYKVVVDGQEIIAEDIRVFLNYIRLNRLK